jgi:hypothetical protein
MKKFPKNNKVSALRHQNPGRKSSSDRPYRQESRQRPEHGALRAKTSRSRKDRDMEGGRTLKKLWDFAELLLVLP